MDFRRSFGLRAPRPIEDSTILVPQLENFSLFATPFLDLNKKFGKWSEEQRDVIGQSEKDSSDNRTTRQKISKEQKEGKGSETTSKEVNQVDISFGIVLNVVTVKPEHLKITFTKYNEIEVKVVQENVVLEYGSIPFKRNCTYRYELPDGVDKNSLVALRTSDDYLIILPRDQVRDDLLNKCIKVPKELAESSDKDSSSPTETTLGKDLDEKAKSVSGPSESKEKKPKSSENKEKAKPKEVLRKDAGDKEMEFVISVVQVTRMLRPGLDVFMLRKYMTDLESYVSTARKFVENASFVTQNSKTAEKCIRYLAKSEADTEFEEINLKKMRKRQQTEPGPDSGYTSTSGASEAYASGSDSKIPGTSGKSELDAKKSGTSLKSMLDVTPSETCDDTTRGSSAAFSEASEENTRESSTAAYDADEDTRDSGAKVSETSGEDTSETPATEEISKLRELLKK